MTPEDLKEGVSILEQLIFVYMRETEQFIGDAIKAGLITGTAEQKLSEIRHEFVNTLGMESQDVFGIISTIGLKPGLAIVAFSAAAKAKDERNKETAKS